MIHMKCGSWSVPVLLNITIFTAACSMRSGQEPGAGIPVVYSTDLFHPHDDPDDHFDIAALYAIDELDIRGIVLDQGDRQEERPGSVPVGQMNHLTGRSVPWAIGLSEPLATPVDDARGQPEKYQAGVHMIVNVLENARDPVTVITVGSLRDVAAAFNRRPDLFRDKVDRLMIFIGEASAATREWNVGLDPHAFIRIMNSGLPVWWVPCFDGGNFRNGGKASFWRADHTDLLRHAGDPIMNFFIYALVEQQAPDPLGYLEGVVNPAARSRVLAMTRNLWCAAVFTAVADRRIVQRDGTWLSVPADHPIDDAPGLEVFRFTPVSLFVDDEARVVYEESDRSHDALRFEIVDTATYPEVMTSVMAHLLGDLPAHISP